MRRGGAGPVRNFLDGQGLTGRFFLIFGPRGRWSGTRLGNVIDLGILLLGESRLQVLAILTRRIVVALTIDHRFQIGHVPDPDRVIAAS